ncbi:MAG TPA: MFS transporter [Acidobacteriota bacterium]
MNVPLDIAERTRRRVTWRIMPYLLLLYIIAFLDRVNVGYANLTMSADLGFSAAVFGTGAGIFFIGYFLLEIPGTLLVENWSARGWIARIMISWGILAVMMGFIHTKTQFYWIRFLLGAAEAGFFPGIIVYLSHWFRYQDRAKALAFFASGITISNIIGSPVSGFLLQFNWLGMAGWRWLFILEGLPAILFGVITIFYLTDWPRQAKWLPDDEREWLTGELERERKLRGAEHSHRIWEALRQRDVVQLAVAYFFIVTCSYGFSFWLPAIVKKSSGLSDFKVTLVSALPYCVGLAGMLLNGWSSDKTGERRWHTAGAILLVSVGFYLSTLTENVALSIGMLCLAALGLFGYLPSFWSLPSSFMTGSAAAASIGLINSVGNLGGFLGPYIVGKINTMTDSFIGGVLYLAASALISAMLVISLRKGRVKISTVAEARAD